METIVARPRKNNTAAYMAKIVRKSEGKVVYHETATFDIGYIKTIPAHATAVRGVVPSTEGIDLARVALLTKDQELSPTKASEILLGHGI